MPSGSSATFGRARVRKPHRHVRACPGWPAVEKAKGKRQKQKMRKWGQIYFSSFIGCLDLKNKSVPIFTLLTFLVGLAYAPTLGNDFVYDDRFLIVQNEQLRRLDSIPQLFLSDWWKGTAMRQDRVLPAVGTQESGDRRYRPLAAVSYVLNYAIGGPGPLGYHLVNLLLHALVSWLFYLVTLEVGLSGGAALVAAVLFALHPLHTEAVAWVSARPELLMSLGVLASLWWAIRGYRWLALAAFAWGLLSKEQAVMLPALILLYDVCAARWAPRGLLRVTWPRYGGYVLVLAGYLLARVAILGGLHPPPYPFLEDPLEFAGGEVWWLSTLKLAGRYLWLTVWPSSLSVDYSYNAIPLAESPADPGVLWALVAWGGLLGLSVWGFRRDRRFSFAVGLTVLSFAPAANVVVSVGTPMAERLFYLPLGGLCLLAGLAYERATSQRHPSPVTHHSSLVTRHLSLFLVVLICLALTLRTVIRNQDWRDAESLFRQAVVMAPENAKAYVFLGGALAKKGQHAQALEAYDTAARLYPDYLRADSFFNSQRGILLIRLGRTPEAVDALEQAATLDPNWGAIRIDLGLAYATMGNYERAEATLRQALSITPGSPHGHSSLSLILNEQGRYAEALAAAEAALERDPTHLWARFNRASALEGLGRREEAVAAYEGVLSLTPGAENRRAFDEAKERLAHLRE